MSPSEELTGLLADVDDLPKGLNLYAAPQTKMEAPGILVKPDFQWMGQSSYCNVMERYTATAFVTASSPEDGIPMLRLLALAIIGALEAPWDWTAVEGPVIDQSIGVPYLAARVLLTYANGGQD